MTRYGMAIDLTRCFGCQTCAVACKMANNVPVDVAYNVVYTKQERDYENPGSAVIKGSFCYDNVGGSYDNPYVEYFPVGCQHCDNASCVEVCPTGATTKDPDTGIVSIDYDLCIGCQSCMKACPYDVRTLLPGDVEYYLEIEVGEHDAPPHHPNTVEKCTFCKNLIDRGEVPACMDLCPGRARYWGDLDDPNSEVSQAIEGRETIRYKESAGTEPNVYYLV